MKLKIVFAFVLILFLISRIYKIAEIPGSVYWDEASIGYNAFSIATDLKDEWGVKLPLHFRAFGEFKLPVYIYSTAILVKMIGLNEYAVRLPAVLYSLGTIIIVYLLVKKITNKEWVAILSSFILSFSPWFFIFSRTGYEATAGLFFFLCAIYLFVINSKRNYLFLLGTFLLIGSVYSYTSYRILSPLVLFGFSVYALKTNFKNKFLVVLSSLIIFVISLIPIARLFIYDAGFGRAQTFALIPGFQQVYDLAGKPHLQITFNRNKDVNWWGNIQTIGNNYFSHFSLNFLFLKGDSNPRSQIPGRGQLYLFEIPLILFGLLAILKSKKIIYFLPLVLLLLSPIPAALTKESPHALRALLAAPSFAIISAFGAMFIKENVKKLGTVVMLIVIVFYYLSFESYITDFLVKYDMETASDWQIEYKEIFLRQKSGVITDKYGQPYIFALFYQKYSPVKFREEVVLNPVNDWGFSKVASFNGFKFEKIN